LKKKRLIQVKDPKLRKIRLSLRQILLKESKKRLNDLLDKEREFLLIDRIFYGKEYFDKLRSFNDQKNKLRNDYLLQLLSAGFAQILRETVFLTPEIRFGIALNATGFWRNPILRN